MDTITLEQMQFYGYHGVLTEENKLGQHFRVDLTLHLPLHEAGRSDNLDDTVNYSEVYRTTRSLVEDRCFRLIEALAETIASELLDSYNKINEITVQVTKVNPPFPAHSNGVSVRIHRRRD